MLFNSLGFIGIFLPVTALVFFLLSRTSHRLAGLWLCACSLFFYGWWNPAYLGLLLASVIFNFGAGYLIARALPASAPRARLLLICALVANLALLGYYKYAGFFAGTLDALTGTHFSLGAIILPLGISFFTFTQIAFLVDVHAGKVKEFDFVHYLLFVTYFPHLIAGPILHHAQMMPQFAQKKTYHLHWDNIAIGLSMFIIGLFKKVMLADMFAGISSPIFNAVAMGGTPQLFESWIGALAYTLQLYFDFSGYCDMAIGISYLFNIRLPLNFNSPYKATNIIDFWRRWHMTLSTFLRDYLYIPLGGNRRGPTRRYVNLLLTMLLGGLWHGAGWTFVIWGGLHGLYLVINHAFHAFRVRMGWQNCAFGYPGRIAATALTFICVMVAWVIFRSPDFHVAQQMLLAMTGWNGISLTHYVPSFLAGFAPWLEAHGIVFHSFTPLAYASGVVVPTIWYKLLAGLVIIWFLPNSQEWMRLHLENPGKAGLPVAESRWHWQPTRSWTWAPLGIVLGWTILTILSGAPSEFLYFQF